MTTRLDPQGTQVRDQLKGLNVSGVVLAQPSLIPHLPHSQTMYALGSKTQPAAPALVLITRVGSLWPFSSEEIDELVRRYEADGAFAPVRSGPLYAFERR